MLHFQRTHCLEGRYYVRNQDSIAMGYSTRTLYKMLCTNPTKFGEGHGISMSPSMTEGEEGFLRGAQNVCGLAPAPVVVKVVPHTKERSQGLHGHYIYTVLSDCNSLNYGRLFGHLFPHMGEGRLWGNLFA